MGNHGPFFVEYRTMTTGQKIIQKQILSVSEADQIYNDLDQLSNTGVWNVPDWATELVKCCYPNISVTHSIIQIAGWKAVAETYKEALLDEWCA